MKPGTLQLYTRLAEWWPLLSDPADYREEAEIFRRVFIHDAIVYMATREQLVQAVRTAYVHCLPGGSALFVPDWIADNFRPGTDHGGHDRGDRGLRYLEWTIDPDPSDGTYSSWMVYLLREGNRVRRSVVDEHVCGLFPEADWLRMIEDAGFRARALPFDHSECVGENRRMFLARKPATGGAVSPAGGTEG